MAVDTTGPGGPACGYGPRASNVVCDAATGCSRACRPGSTHLVCDAATGCACACAPGCSELANDAGSNAAHAFADESARPHADAIYPACGTELPVQPACNGTAGIPTAGISRVDQPAVALPEHSAGPRIP
jgi:hypothetical protein